LEDGFGRGPGTLVSLAARDWADLA
jgi:hypothetical protein